ncbi:MAG: Hsp20/alpha crystallin family protein, partial [Thermoplasmata archaeon]
PGETNDPWLEFERTFDDLSRRFFGSLGLAPAFDAPHSNARASPGKPAFRAMPADVADSGTAYQIVAEVPGVPKDGVDIRVRGSNVEITALHATEATGDDKEVLRRERSYRSFYRAVELPEPVVASEAKATLQNGVLTLELPKQNPTPTADATKVPVQ